MSAPSNRCPFKVNATTNAGIVCENTNCMAYDETNETCRILMAVNQHLIERLLNVTNVKSKINNS